MKKITLILTMVFGLFSTQAQAFDVFHPIRSAEKALVVGAVGYVGVKAATDYLINHPEKTNEWFSVHPEQLIPVTKFIDDKINNAKNQKEFDKYTTLKQRMFLDVDANVAEEYALQNSLAFQTIKAKVDANIQDVNLQLTQLGRMPVGCNKFVLEQLTNDKENFENTINIALPATQSQPGQTYTLDVNTYKRLIDGYKKSNKTIPLQQDHIPSYAAIDKFLNAVGVSTKTTVRINSKGKNVTVRDKDLEANETAIAVPTDIHEKGRTFLGKNTKAKIEWDSSNLLEATALDITTTALAFEQTPSYNVTADQYIDSAMVIYARNKMLCLYDVKKVNK